MKQYSATIYSHMTGKEKTLADGLKELISEGILNQTYPIREEDLKDLEMYTGKGAILQIAHKETEQGSKYKEINLFINGNNQNSTKLEGLVMRRKK